MIEFINLKSFLIQLQICFSDGNVLQIQSNHHPFVVVSSLQALKLLCGCCKVATRRCCCDGRRRVLHTAEQGGRGGPFKLAGIEICWACLYNGKLKETLETFELRDYQRDQPQRHNPDEEIRSSGAFKKEKADDSNTMHNSKHRPNNDIEIHWGRFN